MQVQKLIAPSSEMFCFVTMVTEVCCTESVHVGEGNDYLFFNFWQFVFVFNIYVCFSEKLGSGLGFWLVYETVLWCHIFVFVYSTSVMHFFSRVFDEPYNLQQKLFYFPCVFV